VETSFHPGPAAVRHCRLAAAGAPADAGRMRHFPLAAAAALLLTCGALRAEVDPKNFDLAVKPQDDFYHYANGAWLKSNPIPAEFSRWGGFIVLQEENQKNLHAICERAAAKGGAGNALEKMVGDFFTSGMDEAAVNAAGAKPLQPELDRIAAIKAPADILATLAHLHALGLNAGFNFGSLADFKNSSREMAILGQGGLGLPERDYYFRDDEKSSKLREQYVAHVAKMLTLLGDAPEAAQVNASAIMALETKLAAASLARVKLRNPYASYHKMTVTEAAAQTPGVDWPAYFTATGAPAFAELNFAHPDFLKAFAAQLGQTSIADWQAYLRWHLVHDMAAYLSEPFVKESFNFYSAILTGTTEQLPRWKRVVITVDSSIGDALGQLYVAEYFPPESKARVLKLVADLRAALRERLQALEWMDEATRAKALGKLDAFNVKMGYPDQWKDYRTVQVDRGSYAANVLRASAFEVARNLKKIGGPVDRAEWGMTPPTVNAYYSPLKNEIVFPAGILQPPFFDGKADDAVNYGAIGAVIGHEMTHGFDDRGRQYAADGNLTDWWTPASADKFKARAAAVVKQYSAYTVLDGLHLNGELTQGENIADLGGVKIAYSALEKALAGQPRVAIDGFTPEQRFFLSFATIWRINIRPEALRLRVNTDPHSPGEFRANGPLSNLDEFAQAFGVPEGVPMRRPATERVEIW
jgi:putative endopeptidase